jgi:hypothetical protein
MAQGETPLTLPQYDRMAAQLEAMSATIRARPDMNHHFAERLAILAAQMRENIFEEHPEVEGLSCEIKLEPPRISADAVAAGTSDPMGGKPSASKTPGDWPEGSR